MNLARTLSSRFKSNAASPAPAPSAESDTATFLSMAYRVIFNRELDPWGLKTWAGRLDSGELRRDEVVQALVESKEFRARRWAQSTWEKRAGLFLDALHRARLLAIAGLPKADVIVDLGGSCEGRPEGALVAYGYPYEFTGLTIVDLPRDQRHAIYAEICGEYPDVIATPLGPVRYAYTTLADLSPFADGSTDLVYSGQSIEHVTRADAARACREAHRILRPGGYFCLDTPNRAATVLQNPDGFTNPDHKHEYTHAELSSLLREGGFAIREAKGIVLVADSIRRGALDWEREIEHVGIYDDIEHSYFLYYKCQKV